MISIDDDGEFTYTIFDLIKILSQLDKFVVKIWTNNSELAFTYDESSDFHFLQESIRVSRGSKVSYIALDNVVSIIVYKDATLDEVY